MKIWKIYIKAAKRPNDDLLSYIYTGTGTTAEIALRKMAVQAKKDQLWKIEIQSLEYVGPKEF